MTTTTDRELLRRFALRSVAVVALVGATLAAVQWFLLRDTLFERERTGRAEVVRAAAHAFLEVDDFEDWRTADAQAQFERFHRRLMAQPGLLRTKVYDRAMRVIWSDEPRLIGRRFPDNARLAEALGGRIVSHLEHAQTSENVFERDFRQIVEVYVPVVLPDDSGPVLAGVVELYTDWAGVLANIGRVQLVFVLVSMAGAVVLYLALFGIIHRAAQDLRTQQQDLETQKAALSAARSELDAVRRQLGISERLAAVGEVSSALAHAIRNPLANIRACAQVSSRHASEELGRYLATITGEVDRLERWLRALLDLGRPLAPGLAVVAVNNVLEDAVEALAERARIRGVVIVSHLASGLPDVPGDPVQIEHALLAVLENGLDALPPGGRLRVMTRHDSAAGDLEVVIIDDGDGIPADHIERVSDPFYTTKSQGTGLGLAIARKVIDAHGGRMVIASRPDVGTTVTITLPTRAATATVPMAA